MIEHPHSYIGFSHCLDCAKHAYEQLERENERLKAEPTVVERRIVDRIQQLEQENERLKQSMMQHFSEEHLAGDGPEIDRWKAQNRQLEQQNAELRAKVQSWMGDLESVNDGQVHGDPQQTIKLVVGSMKAALNVQG